MKLLKFVFSEIDIRKELKTNILKSFLFASESKYFDFEVFMKIFRIITKETNENVRIEYVYDIFTKYDKSRKIGQKEIHEIISCFQVPQVSIEELQSELHKKTSLNKDEFISLFKQLQIQLGSGFGKLKYILNVEFGVTPESPLQECDVINNLLDNQKLDVFMRKNMVEGMAFYLLNKSFWEEWRSYSGHNQKKISSAKRPLAIKNEEFKVQKDSIKLKDIMYD